MIHQKGNVFFNNDLITKLSDNNKSILRNKHIGFVYQSHHLLKDFSAIENVMMPLIIRRNDSLKDFNQAKKILKKLGLGSRLNHFPHQLVGRGEAKSCYSKSNSYLPRHNFS